MFPDVNRKPSQILEFGVLTAVSFDVRIQLPSPPGFVRFRLASMQWTAVPEAPVDEDGDFRSRKRHVRSARKTLKVDPVTQTTPVQLAP